MREYVRRVFAYKSTYALLAISVFSMLLSVCRVLATGYSLFMFMLWNLFLAFVPWLAASVAYVRDIRSKPLLLVIILFWLAFFPNAPYVLTDLIHLGKGSSAPVWYDLILLLSYGFAGLIYGFTSLQMIEEKVRTVFAVRHAGILSGLLIYVSCFGIYLGRFLRWNSWDLISNADQVMRDVFHRMAYPRSHPTTWVFTILFGTLLNIVYLVFKQDALRPKARGFFCLGKAVSFSNGLQDALRPKARGRFSIN